VLLAEEEERRGRNGHIHASNEILAYVFARHWKEAFVFITIPTACFFVVVFASLERERDRKRLHYTNLHVHRVRKFVLNLQFFFSSH
jgi:hypothetical protein